LIFIQLELLGLLFLGPMYLPFKPQEIFKVAVGVVGIFCRTLRASSVPWMAFQ